MGENIIEFRNVTYCYPNGLKALDEINIQIPRGKKVVFLGANGSGKSTTFLHMNGTLKPTAGEVLFAGEVVSNHKKVHQDLWKKVGIVFQDPDIQVFAPLVYEEVSFGPQNLGLSKEQIAKRIEGAMKVTDVIHLKDRTVHSLSCGEKKRVTIADIVAMNPDVMILDEPTASLDPQQKNRLVGLLDDLCQDGKTLIMSTHDVDLAYEWGEYIIVMKEGHIWMTGPKGAIFQEKEKLLEANLELPTMIEVYEALRKSGRLEASQIPTSKGELLALLELP